MGSEQFSLIFSVVCCCISVISAIVAGAYGLEAHKDFQEYKKAEAEKKRVKELRNFINDLQKR
ncbi:hypothetical protein [Rothia sp. HMSC068F09]|uniref:hypothetical protein n=1 Tax=Rothia sp. HMSC068F09 TaxID=1739378 RepID=UPI0008A3E99F|nr:hypothetical protein [Rothia sp. HMSC068F09]OFR69774.1 hypothetical protein HMPREF2874_04965 [Rothia sp. HMSC068F09]